MKPTLTVYWTDGYEAIYELDREDELKFEELYINIQRKTGECLYIPMTNIRFFYTNMPAKTGVIKTV